jgi:TonB family protein
MDPEYVREIKRRIEENWRYPEAAIRARKSGRGVVRFILRRDGSVRRCDITVVSSSGVPILDQFIVHAITFASPFPPLPPSIAPDAISLSVNFTYIPGGQARPLRLSEEP